MSTKEFDVLIWPVQVCNQIMGVWPSNKKCGLIIELITSFQLHFMFLIAIFYVVTATVDTVRNRFNINDATECALVASAGYLSFFRFIAILMHRKDVAVVVEEIKSDWNQLNPQSKEILREKTYYVYRLAKFFIISILISVFAFSIGPVLQHEHNILPFRGYYFVDHPSRSQYRIMYIFNVTVGFFVTNTISSATSFSLIIVMHAATKFSILQTKIKSLHVASYKSQNCINNLIREHQNAIRFAKVVARLISLITLGQFVISSILLCFAGFQMTMLEEKRSLIKYVLFINSALLEMFIFSYSSNQLITESEKMSYSSYESCWIVMNKQVCNKIVCIMIRSNRYCKITAGGFFDVSLKTFAGVLQTSFSYFTMLRAVNDDE